MLVPAVLAAGVAFALTRDDEQPSTGQGQARELARLADLSPAADISKTTPLRPFVATPGRAGLRIERLDPPAGGVRPARPARISIPDARVDAVVDPVRGTDDGIEVPDVGRAGWFDAGPRPGEPGRSIVVGHLDSRKGPGLFARVPSLPAGARIAVTDSRGSVHDYAVVGVTTVEKSKFPERAVYGPSKQPVLVLITCGGPYRPGEGYRDNVLVYARAA